MGKWQFLKFWHAKFCTYKRQYFKNCPNWSLLQRIRSLRPKGFNLRQFRIKTFVTIPAEAVSQTFVPLFWPGSECELTAKACSMLKQAYFSYHLYTWASAQANRQHYIPKYLIWSLKSARRTIKDNSNSSQIDSGRSWVPSGHYMGKGGNLKNSLVPLGKAKE